MAPRNYSVLIKRTDFLWKGVGVYGIHIKYKNIIFDCDSTLTKIEGLDVIAQKHGLGKEISTITTMAMNGEVTFEEALKLRLEMIGVSKSDLDWLGQEYIKNVTLGAMDLINYLKSGQVNTYIVSGGLRPAVETLANYLGIDRKNVYAVCYRKYGEKLILEKNCLMRREDGKKQILRKLSRTGPTVMIGDGMTDYNAGKFADLFIGFGGIVKREKVKKLAKIFIEGENLMSVSKYLI